MNSVAANPPSFPESVVADAVADQFKLVGDYVNLVSERDQNFRLQSDDGASYMVKVTSLAQDSAVTDFQIAALLHLQDAGLSGVPQVVRTTTGSDRGEVLAPDGSIASLRIVSWLPGRLLGDCELTPAIAGQLGARLAKLDIALQDFSHPGEAQDLLWDTQRAGELRDLLCHVDNVEIRDLLTGVLDDFGQHVQPVLPSLPTQVIHNDSNSENVLIDDVGRVSGIIDFGDMLRAPRIIELSTAAAYLRDDVALRCIVPFVESYRAINPLASHELDLLFDLTRTRLMMTIVLFYWRLAARSADDPYRQKQLEKESGAFKFLQSLNRIGRMEFRSQIQ